MAYPKSRDNSLTTAGQLVGCPSRPALASGQGGRSGRLWVGAKPDRRENPDDRKNIDPGKILYIIMFNSTFCYRLGMIKAIQIINEAR